jgi:hypothetical protein
MAEALSAARRLAAALDALETGLRSGLPGGLPEIGAEIEEAAAALSASGATGRDLAVLRQRTVRLLARIDAARQGVLAARARLRALSAAREGIGTYDRSGTRSVLAPTGRRQPPRG